MFELEDTDERVGLACSFSKAVCLGIRVGCLVAVEALIGRIVKRATDTYISPNLVAQSIVNESAAPETSTPRSRPCATRRCC